MYNTLSSMPSTSSVVSTYTAFAASAMLVRSVFREIQSMTTQLIPKCVRDKIVSKFRFLFDRPSSEMTLIIDQQVNGLSQNEVYEASQLYLKDKISPSNTTLRVTKRHGDKDLSVAANKGEEVIDFYQGVKLRWVLVCTEPRETHSSGTSDKVEHRSFHLSFMKVHKETILGSYLPHLLELAKSRTELNRVVKIKSLGGKSAWGGINLNHPSTFDTLAMDPVLKKAIMDDLDRFVKRREFYRRVGKAWKRGYLLYGPPGTGKSSLIAAMANYLKFDVYDLDLTSIRDNYSLRSLLFSTRNRSILVIEDIDCGVALQNRQSEGDSEGEAGVPPNNGLTLSGLLNFIDGLWSSFGDQRIIVFTTNYKEKLDPALLRPGRMDMHIHMSYLTQSAFRVLAFNYLGIRSHPLFSQIEDLLAGLEITPATVAEELMRSDHDADATLESLLQFLQNKKSEVFKSSPQGEKESIESEQEIEETSYLVPKLIGGKRKVPKNRISHPLD